MAQTETSKIINGNHRCSGGASEVKPIKAHPNSSRTNGGKPMEGASKPHPNSHRCSG